MSDPPEIFASFADQAIALGDISLLANIRPPEWIAIPFYEPWNGRWLKRSTPVWAAVEGECWQTLVPLEVNLDVHIALSVHSEAVGYLNWYTEIALLFGTPDEVRKLTGLSAEHLFIESCANTFGQGVALLDRHIDAPKVFDAFGQQFSHPFHV